MIIRPKTFLGPERLGVFEILFDWIRDGRRIYVLGGGANRYQLLAVEDLVDAIARACTADVAGEVFNVGATEFGTVRSDLEALIAHAGTRSRLRPVPARPAELALRALELAKAVAARRVALQDRVARLVRRRLEGASGCSAGMRRSPTSRRSSRTTTGTSRTARRCRPAGVTHRVPWNQQALAWLKKVS